MQIMAYHAPVSSPMSNTAWVRAEDHPMLDVTCRMHPPHFGLGKFNQPYEASYRSCSTSNGKIRLNGWKELHGLPILASLQPVDNSFRFA